jgi:hypothetical protein
LIFLQRISPGCGGDNLNGDINSFKDFNYNPIIMTIGPFFSPLEKNKSETKFGWSDTALASPTLGEFSVYPVRA